MEDQQQRRGPGKSGMKATIRLGLTVAALAVLAAGCSSAATSGSGSSSQAASAPAEQPAPATTGQQPTGTTWRLGGAYTGPWPPDQQPMPQPYRAFSMGHGTLYIGTPLHSNIPTRAFDCYMNDDSGRPLPAGEYVIPFAIQLHDGAAAMPQVWAADPTITGGDGWPARLQTTGQESSQLVWEGSGDCEYPGGLTGTMFGVIGPLTQHDLRHGVVYWDWSNDGTTPETAQWHRPLRLAIPGGRLP